MALASLLSAMRTLILDAPEVPEEQIERVRHYRSVFPELSHAEVDDLAKIAPAKFKIYTTSIFNGETDLIRNNFKVSCSLLEEIAADAGRPFALKPFVRLMHKFYPWKSWTTAALIENFLRFLNHPAAELGSWKDAAVEMASFEQQIFLARRKQTTAHDSEKCLSIPQIAAVTVGQLLETGWVLHETTSIQEYQHNVPELYERFSLTKACSLAEVRRAPCSIMVYREPSNTVGWTTIPKYVGEIFKAKRQGTVAEVAEAFVASANAASEEAELFAQFSVFLDDLLRRRTVQLSGSERATE